MDDNRELTGTYLQRVGTALSAGLQPRARPATPAPLCQPLRWYAPATTRCKYVRVSSLMTSMSSNGRIRGVPTQRRKRRVAEGFYSFFLIVCTVLGVCFAAFRREGAPPTGKVAQDLCFATDRMICDRAVSKTSMQPTGHQSVQTDTHLRRLNHQ